MSWYAVDHRAPALLPRNQSDPESVIAFVGTVGAVGTVALVGVWTGGAPLGVSIPVTAVWLVWAWWMNACRRYVFRVRAAESFGSYDGQHAIRDMQQVWRDRPDLRETIEPVLVASYSIARRGGRARDIERRRDLVQRLVRDTPVPEAWSDESDLEDL